MSNTYIYIYVVFIHIYTYIYMYRLYLQLKQTLPASSHLPSCTWPETNGIVVGMRSLLKAMSALTRPASACLNS